MYLYKFIKDILTPTLFKFSSKLKNIKFARSIFKFVFIEIMDIIPLQNQMKPYCCKCVLSSVLRN